KRYCLFNHDDRNVLMQLAAQVHFNPPLLSVVKRNVLKALLVKPTAQFIINSLEDIQVERSCDALGVVIGRDEDRGGSFQIDAEEKDVPGSQNCRRASKEFDAFFGREVPQTGAEKGHGFFLQLKRLNDLRLSREIGVHGANLNMAIFLQEPASRVP